MHASSLALLTPSPAAPQPSTTNSNSSESSFASALASSQPSSSSATNSGTAKGASSSTAKNSTPTDSNATATTKGEDAHVVQNESASADPENATQSTSEDTEQGFEDATELIQAALFIASEAVQLRSSVPNAETSATLTTVHGKAGAQLLADQPDTMAARMPSHASDATQTSRHTNTAQILTQSALNDSTRIVQRPLSASTGIDTQANTLIQQAARSGLTSLAAEGSASNSRVLPTRDADGLRSSLAKALNQSDVAGRKATLSVQLNQAVQAASDTAGSRAVKLDLPAALQSNLRQEGIELNALSTSLGANGALSTQSATSLPTTPLQGQLTAALQQGDWGTEFGRQMIQLTRGLADGHYQAELRLNPAELGPVRISLTLADNVAHAHIVSAHTNVRHAIEQALPQLQQAMQQAGLSLGNTDVSDQGLAQSFTQDTSDQASSDTEGHFAQLLNGEPMGSPSQVAPPEPSRSNDSLIDTFA